MLSHAKVCWVKLSYGMVIVVGAVLYLEAGVLWSGNTCMETQDGLSKVKSRLAGEGPWRRGS